MTTGVDASARMIGSDTRDWCRSAASYRLLDKYIRGDTWMAGGCVALAFGLRVLLPKSHLVVMVADLGGRQVVDHVGVEYKGAVIDAEGAHASRLEWVRKWERFERPGQQVSARRLRIRDTLPNTTDGAEEIAAALLPTARRRWAMVTS